MLSTLVHIQIHVRGWFQTLASASVFLQVLASVHGFGEAINFPWRPRVSEAQLPSGFPKNLDICRMAPVKLHGLHGAGDI